MDRFVKMEREQAILIVVDVQNILMKQMNQEVGEKVIRNICTLLAFAKEMTIPILITEQYPKGLGKTVSEIKMELGSLSPIEKVSFSCCGVKAFNDKLNQLARNQAILTGIETHVCVLQTTNDLIKKGYGAPRASPWSPKTIPTYAKALVGHLPMSEIRRSVTH